MARTPRTGAIAVAVAAGVALVGCNLNLYVDAQRLEQTISDGIAAQSHLTATSVDCPDQQPLQPGNVFTCTAKLSDGRTLLISVTQEGDGNMGWKVAGQR